MSRPVVWMHRALDQARKALEHDEVPVGAVLLTPKGRVCEDFNRMHATGNPMMHAEMRVMHTALSQALNAGAWLLEGCTLYVTLEPCAMCAHALRLARIHTVWFGAWDVSGGAVDHGPRLFDDRRFFRPHAFGGLCEQQSRELLEKFFRTKRPPSSAEPF